MSLISTFVLLVAFSPASPPQSADDRPAQEVKVLLITGQNNHDWRRTTPLLQEILDGCGRFKVTVTTAPEEAPPSPAWDAWRPDFSAYGVVVSDYNGALWPEPVRKAFEEYVKGGGGGVLVHAANNAFEGWTEYEKMCGLLWRGPAGGYRVYYDEAGELHRLPPGEGPGASHGAVHDWQIMTRDPQHPIMQGLPKLWLHPADELYHAQRGPAENMHILASAYSDPQSRGTGLHEPQIWWIPYGKGRVVTFLPGHLWAGQTDQRAFQCVGFRTLLQRCCEWAATEKVTIPVPANFPTADRISVVPGREAKEPDSKE